MPLWKFTPAAAPQDHNWQDRTIWSELIVEAPSAAFARQIAAEWEFAQRPRRVGNESPSAKSGFQDEKLYHVRQLDAEAAALLAPASGGAHPVRHALRHG